MEKIFREIVKTSKESDYELLDKDKDDCHLGQRKLLFAEIDFFNYVSKYINLGDALIVYIGSSPGTYIDILKKLYPETHYMLYDPRTIEIKFRIK
jgi:hypothetical protein